MEGWSVVPGGKENGVWALAIYTTTQINEFSFPRQVQKISKLSAENNGKPMHNFLNDSIVIMTYTFENEVDYDNFQKAFENP